MNGSDFSERLRSRARQRQARIGFPEGGDRRVRAAADRLAEEGLVVPMVYGPPETDDAAAGLTAAVGRLAEGSLDGVVAGALLTTGQVIRAGLGSVGVAEGMTTVSSAFYMCLARQGPGGQTVITFTDPAVVPSPTAGQLAESARAACLARRSIVGDEPQVAFLSYATHGSATGPAVDRVIEAVEQFRRLEPDVAADGPLQADAALVPQIGASKTPGSPVAGRANILVFPNLDAANVGYKLVERLAGARALGPILQGLARPLNDLSRGASVEDIVEVACITALMTRRDSR